MSNEEQILKILGQLQGQMTDMQGQMADMQEQITDIKGEMSLMKTDIRDLKEGQNDIKDILIDLETKNAESHSQLKLDIYKINTNLNKSEETYHFFQGMKALVASK